jgi:hypothetical protein
MKRLIQTCFGYKSLNRVEPKQQLDGALLRLSAITRKQLPPRAIAVGRRRTLFTLTPRRKMSQSVVADVFGADAHGGTWTCWYCDRLGDDAQDAYVVCMRCGDTLACDRCADAEMFTVRSCATGNTRIGGDAVGGEQTFCGRCRRNCVYLARCKHCAQQFDVVIPIAGTATDGDFDRVGACDDCLDALRRQK